MIGIFGGTFDPIHYGHLRTALEVAEIFGLDEVRFIPSAMPPHRPQPVANAAMRMVMLTLAIAQQANFVADDRELQRPGHSYMVDTLHSLRQDFPHQTLILFMGSDAFSKIDTWHRWQTLFSYAHVVVLVRPGFQLPLLDNFLAERWAADQQLLHQCQAGKLLVQAVTQLDISATTIRHLVANQQNPRFLLPDAVIDYIKRHGLYR
jgi:nicotinate-nucleotide adenylyltransferase